MTKPSTYGAAGIYRTAEPSLSNNDGSALALSKRGNTFTESYPEQIKIVEDSGYTYVCFATVGTAVASAAWKIFRADATGNILYASADDGYIHVATDPTALTYVYS